MTRARLLFALLWLPFVVGCEGCRRGDEPEQEEDVPVEQFTSRPPRAFPADASAVGGIKPGHWMTASQSLKSNKTDARGNLVSRSTATATGTSGGRDETVDGVLPSMRPVVLPKGQSRRFDFRILPPLPPSSDQQRLFLSSRLLSTGRSLLSDEQPFPFGVLGAEEVFFVILTERPERFAKFQVADWVRPYRDEYSFKDSRSNYRVVIPGTKDILPLAETMLDWTSTAVVLWDDLSPDALTPQQTRAVADWVRYGGQLIVNGADGSDAVANTALADLLPIKPSGNVELDANAASEMLRSWAVPSDRSTEKQIALLESQAGRVSFEGPRSESAQFLENSGDLVVTKRAGTGRVVQSRFDLTSDWLTNWESYDSFVNSVFLSRPRRVLTDDVDAAQESFLQQKFPDWTSAEFDPAINTRFRLTARDAWLRNEEGGSAYSSGLFSSYDPLTSVNPVSGISGWTDSSDVIGISRQVLRSESGIEIPESSLVVRSLGYYLLILVPVNYLIFRLIGRLEYAWLAVPVIAIGGAIWVARAARLDIGFARSQNEIGFLETHAGYQRAHLSRVVAIYNSLSDTYEIEFDNMDAAAAPVRESRRSFGSSGSVFETGYSSGPRLTDFSVISNKVRMMHAEQMLDIGGAIELDATGRLVNRTPLTLEDAVVVERGDDGVARIAFLGLVDGGSVKDVKLRPIDEIQLATDLPMQTNLLIERLASPKSIPRGSMRLIARYDGALEGMSISPATQQSASQTVVLAHLKYAPYPTPQCDLNLIGDLRKVLTDEETEGNDSEGDDDEGSDDESSADDDVKADAEQASGDDTADSETEQDETDDGP